jgi:mannose-6-phosphate isomerase-like protein (cupin superfamily)
MATPERAALVERLRREGLDPAPWSNGPGDTYAAHRHDYDKVLVVAAGSIVFGTDAGRVALALGDRLDLPAGARHDAQVGPEGVTCLECHLPAGSLGGLRWIAAGEW